MGEAAETDNLAQTLKEVIRGKGEGKGRGKIRETRKTENQFIISNRYNFYKPQTIRCCHCSPAQDKALYLPLTCDPDPEHVSLSHLVPGQTRVLWDGHALVRLLEK